MTSDRRPSYFVYVGDSAGPLTTEVAGLLVAGLGDIGYLTVFPARGLPEKSPSRVNLVVGPHLFFSERDGEGRDRLAAAAAASALVVLEAPGSPAFESDARWAAMATTSLALSSAGADLLYRRGVNVSHLQLGYHASWDRWGGDPSRPRPKDLVVFGAWTDHRSRVIGNGAHLLYDYDTEIRLFDSTDSASRSRLDAVPAPHRWDLLASSKVALNVCPGADGSMEWAPMLEAAANGCLIVTDGREDFGPLVPGQHLVVAPPGLLAEYAMSLLEDEQSREEMTTAAYDVLRSKLQLTSLLEPVCATLDVALGGAPGDDRWTRPVHPLFRTRPETEAEMPAETGPRAAGGDPLEAVLPPPDSMPSVQDSAPPADPPSNRMPAMTRTRAALKALVDDETALLRRVERLQATLAHGAPDHFDIEVTPAWEDFLPEVSVVVSCYNYEGHVGEAIESVMASAGVEVELVVVDDHSSDNSVDAIRQVMAANPWFPMTSVQLAANGGVARSRNTGTGRARADKLFFLDADDRVWPTALARLSSALDGDPDAAFSYGLVSTFTDGPEARSREPLLSFLCWDVVRLCRGNYITAMAMIRRDALDEAAGYDSTLSGWEDYDLWLHLAASGRRGLFVPEFAGSYRFHPYSRNDAVSLDTAALLAELRDRYPQLPWSSG